MYLCPADVELADFIRRYSALKSMVQRCMVHMQLSGQVEHAGGFAPGGTRAPGGGPTPRAATGVSVLVAEAVHATAARARVGLCEQCSSTVTAFAAHHNAVAGATGCALGPKPNWFGLGVTVPPVRVDTAGTAHVSTRPLIFQAPPSYCTVEADWRAPRKRRRSSEPT